MLGLSAAQLDLRKTYLGGTDIAAIAGASPWRGPLATYLSKVQDEAMAKPPDASRQWIMDVGNYLEPTVAQMYADRKGIARDALATLQDPVFVPGKNYLGANPDRLIPSLNKGLEIKTTGEGELQRGDQWGEDGTDHVPLHYLVQCQWYMGITGLHQWDLAAFFLGTSREFRIYPLTFDPEIFDVLLEKGEAFWHNHVLARVPPEDDPDLSLMASFLASKCAKNTEEMPAPKDAEPIAAVLKRISIEKERLKGEEASARTALLKLLRDEGAKKFRGAGWTSSIVSPGPKKEINFEMAWMALISALSQDRKTPINTLADKILADHTSTKTDAAYLLTRFSKKEG